MISKRTRRFLVVVAMAPTLANAERYIPPQPQIIIAREIYNLHTLTFVISCAIFVVVFGATIYSIFKHRSAAGHGAKQFHQNVMVEIAWTIIPFLILIGLAWPAMQSLLPM